MYKCALAAVILAACASTAMAQISSPNGPPPVSPNGVKTLSPAGAIKPTGTWDVASRAGDFIYIAGMRGIDPATNMLVQGDEARIRQAFMNMKLIAESEGASLRDCVRIVVYVTDMFRYRPIANKIQEELWGKGPYPPRTIVEVHRLNQDDILEVEGTFYAPAKKSAERSDQKKAADRSEHKSHKPGTTTHHAAQQPLVQPISIGSAATVGR